MSDKSLLQLPLAVTAAGALVYGVQDNKDVAIPASVLQGSEQPQPANTIFAGPAAAPGGFPNFRPLVMADIPDLSSLYVGSNGGSLVNTTLYNPTIVDGNISGTTAVFDDTRLTIRDQIDTTKRFQFEASSVPTGSLVYFTVPSASTTLVGTDADQALVNKTIVVKPSVASGASFRVPHGVAPSSPQNGDVWTTAAGMFVRVNNATVGPLAAAAGTTVVSFNGRQGAVTLSSSDVTNALGYTPLNSTTGVASVNGRRGDVTIQSADVTTALGYTPYNAGSSTVWTNANFNPNTKVSWSNTADWSSVAGVWLNFTTVASSSDPLFWTAPSQYVTIHSLPATSPLYGVAVAASYNNENRFWLRSRYDQGGAEPWQKWKAWAELALTGLNQNVTFGTIGCGNITSTGRVTATGGWGPVSDPRLKEKDSLVAIDNALEMVYNLDIKKGRYIPEFNSDGRDRLFIMADKAMEENAPEVFAPSTVDHDGKKFNSWNADQMIALLAQAVKDLTDEVRALKEKIID